MNRELIDQITEIEFKMFSSVNNTGGQASCQSDRKTFRIMRSSQFEIYSDQILESWLEDLKAAEASGRNLMTEKYARMMESTHPQEYELIRNQLPGIPETVSETVSVIMEAFVTWNRVLSENYPALSARGRSENSSEDSHFSTSKETYLKCELLTYSEKTLKLIEKWVQKHKDEGINLAEKLLLSTVKKYGYTDLEEAESAVRKGKG